VETQDGGDPYCTTAGPERSSRVALPRHKGPKVKTLEEAYEETDWCRAQ